MYKIENLNNKYSDIAVYLKEKKYDLDHVTIAVKDTTVKISRDLLLLTSPLMRNILASYPACLTPLVIIPDDIIKSEAVENVVDILLNTIVLGELVLRDEVITDIGVFLDLMDIDKNLIAEIERKCGTKTKIEKLDDDYDLKTLVKEEGEDECLMNAIDEMERLLECENVLSETKQESDSNISNPSDNYSSKREMLIHSLTSENLGGRKESTKGLKYTCVDCDKEFGTNSNLGLHQRRVHIGEKPFSCDVCEQTFALKESMHSHRVKDHGKPNPFQCVECKKGFIKKRNLQSHMEIIHLGLRKFNCQKCSKSFTRDHSLKVHKLTHTDQTPWKCVICSQGFKEKRNMMKHMERMHPN